VNGHPLRLIPGAALAAILVSGLVLPERVAIAAEPEQAAVRNRYYKDSGRIEVMLMSGISLANTLTSMYTPALNIAYHFDEVWAIEAIVGYAAGGVTSLQSGAQNPVSATGGAKTTSVFQNAYTQGRQYNDLANLWTMNGFNAQLGARWEPVYGKLSLLTTLPIHFKWYLDADVGISQFTRNSLYYCQNYDLAADNCKLTDPNNPTGTYQTVQGSRWSWVASIGSGMRFIFLEKASLLIGLREYLWYDTYTTGFNGTQFVPPTSPPVGTCLPGSTTCNIQHGITPTLFVDLGLSWTF
jgi:outer membrane beta-barrel protein